MQHRKGHLTGGQVTREPLDFAEPSLPHAPGQLLLHKHTLNLPRRYTQEIITSQQGMTREVSCHFLLIHSSLGLKLCDFGLWAQLNFSLCLKQAHMQKLMYLRFPF